MPRHHRALGRRQDHLGRSSGRVVSAAARPRQRRRRAVAGRRRRRLARARELRLARSVFVSRHNSAQSRLGAAAGERSRDVGGARACRRRRAGAADGTGARHHRRRTRRAGVGRRAATHRAGARGVAQAAPAGAGRGDQRHRRRRRARHPRPAARAQAATDHRRYRPSRREPGRLRPRGAPARRPRQQRPRPEPMSGQDLAPEFLLAAACCRWPPSAERRGAIAAAAARVADWNGFLAVVRRQRIAGLAHAALSEAGIAPPAEIARQLAARAQAIAQRNRALAAETALVQLAYGTLALKHARDIDLLVAPEQAAAAMLLLERDDYALRLPAAQMSEAQRRLYVQYGHDVEMVSRERSASIELHWRLAYNMTLLRGIDARAPTQAVALPGGAVRTLADEALFAYLCVHGALHGWARLKWLADLNAWLSGRGELERRYREADAVGAGLCAGLALLLCRRLFDLELPAGLQRDR